MEKVKEEKYNLGQKGSTISNQLKEKSENIGTTVKMQASAVMAGSATKAKEAEMAMKEKSNKIKEKSQLAGEVIKERSNVVSGAIKNKSVYAGEALKSHTLNAGNNVKIKTFQASEAIKDKTNNAMETIKSNAKHSGKLEKTGLKMYEGGVSQEVETREGIANLKHGNSTVKEEVRPEKATPNKFANNSMNNSKIVQKSQEILRKKAKKAGQIFDRVILISSLPLHN